MEGHTVGLICVQGFVAEGCILCAEFRDGGLYTVLQAFAVENCAVCKAS